MKLNRSLEEPLMTDEKRAEAQRLRKAGHSYRKIALILGCGATTARMLVNEDLYIAHKRKNSVASCIKWHQRENVKWRQKPKIKLVIPDELVQNIETMLKSTQGDIEI